MASAPRSVSWWSDIVKPSIRREPTSKTLSRCLPSSVPISVPSPYHLRLSVCAANWRSPGRAPAIGRDRDRCVTVPAALACYEGSPGQCHGDPAIGCVSEDATNIGEGFNGSWAVQRMGGPYGTTRRGRTGHIGAEIDRHERSGMRQGVMPVDHRQGWPAAPSGRIGPPGSVAGAPRGVIAAIVHIAEAS
jgi:hypothetical protein